MTAAPDPPLTQAGPRAADATEAATEATSRLVRFGAEEAGLRLDKALARHAGGLSRTRLKALILAGLVSEGADVLDDPSAAVAEGQEVRLDLPPPEAAEPEPEALPLAILFEDEHLIVIDKPAGLVVHPAPGHWRGTLVNALLHHCGPHLSGVGGVRRPGIVHRLDKDTSGVMVVAKSDAAHQGLAAQFADKGRGGALRRDYVAYVWGEPAPARFTIDRPLLRDPRHRDRMAVAKPGTGRAARTHVERLQSFGHGRAARLACRLETGRTHQIRVHLTEAGLPLIGDPLYGTGFKSKLLTLPAPAQAAIEALNRQALHAVSLAFTHPLTHGVLEFVTELPADLARLHEELERL